MLYNNLGMKEIYTSTEQRLGLLEALLQHFGLNSSEIAEFKHHVLSMDDKSLSNQDLLLNTTNPPPTPTVIHGNICYFKFIILILRRVLR